MQELHTRLSAQILEIWRNIIERGEKCWINGIELSFTGGYEVMD